MSDVEAPSVFAHATSSTLTLPLSVREYCNDVGQLGQELDRHSTAFARPEYLGHMNFDVSRPHMDGLRVALRHNPTPLNLERSQIE